MDVLSRYPELFYEWRYVIPLQDVNKPEPLIEYTNSSFSSVYFNPDGIIRRARKILKNVEFDTFVGTGLSGTLVIPMLAKSMKKDFLVIEKPGTSSHRGTRLLYGRLQRRWIFVDDLISTGNTLARVKQAVVTEYRRSADPRVRRCYPFFVGVLLYQNNEWGRDGNITFIAGGNDDGIPEFGRDSF